MKTFSFILSALLVLSGAHGLHAANTVSGAQRTDKKAVAAQMISLPKVTISALDTAFLHAVQQHNFTTALSLLQQGANYLIVDSKNKTVLDYALDYLATSSLYPSQGQAVLEFMLELLKRGGLACLGQGTLFYQMHGKNYTLNDLYKAFWQFAIEHSDTTIDLQALIAQGANPVQKMYSQETILLPITFAIHEGKKEAALLLLEHMLPDTSVIQ
jgi:hypothetical protein